MTPSPDSGSQRRRRHRRDTRASVWVLRSRPIDCHGEAGAGKGRVQWLAALVRGAIVGGALGWVAALLAIVAGRIGVASSQSILVTAVVGSAAFGACFAFVAAWRAPGEGAAGCGERRTTWVFECCGEPGSGDGPERAGDGNDHR